MPQQVRGKFAHQICRPTDQDGINCSQFTRVRNRGNACKLRGKRAENRLCSTNKASQRQVIQFEDSVSACLPEAPQSHYGKSTSLHMSWPRYDVPLRADGISSPFPKAGLLSTIAMSRSSHATVQEHHRPAVKRSHRVLEITMEFFEAISARRSIGRTRRPTWSRSSSKKF